jgi:hypothetical protein
MNSSGLSSVIVLPRIAAIVRSSACRGSKSVEASTILSPRRQPLASSTAISALRASTVAGELGPGVLAVAMQVERAAGEQDAAVAHGVDVLRPGPCRSE